MEHNNITVSVVGSGYVGTTTAALLANIGIKTFAIDIDENKIAKLKSGKAPFFEAGLDALVAQGIASGNLIPTTSYQQAIPNSNIVMSSVGTPDNPDGSPNLDFVFSALDSIASFAKPELIYVQKSTVPVGTGQQIIDHFKTKNSSSKFSYVSAPEFLREGSAVIDSIIPDRIVVGGQNPDVNMQIADIFMTVFEQYKNIAGIAQIACPDSAQKPTIFNMNLESAELTKVTANAFLALKISFANSIAVLADTTGADVVEVMDAVGADNRIGRAFLNAGRGYGGGCFPKDVSGLISSADRYHVDMSIMSAATKINNSMSDYVVSRLTELVDDNDLKDKKIAVLGLAFKAGTSDVRKSPGIKIANKLAELEAQVSAYDPEANHEAQDDLDSKISLHNNYREALKSATAVIIATDWAEFSKISASEFSELMTGKIIFDAVNMLDPKDFSDMVYQGVGRK